MTEQEMMENWMRNATPGPQHEKLAKESGEYEVSMVDRGVPMTGNAKIEMILDGRVQVQNFWMDYNGMPFKGFGMTGYDNFTQRYWFTWNDNMSTGLYSLWGNEEDGGKRIVFEGLMDKPGLNMKQCHTKHIFTYLNDNEFRMEIIDFPGTPEEKPTMDMTYKRK